MDTRQAVNLVLLEYCNCRNIEFAFSSQTLRVASVPVCPQSSGSAGASGKIGWIPAIRGYPAGCFVCPVPAF
jgi:hypothetical protein